MNLRWTPARYSENRLSFYFFSSIHLSHPIHSINCAFSGQDHRSNNSDTCLHRYQSNCSIRSTFLALECQLRNFLGFASSSFKECWFLWENLSISCEFIPPFKVKFPNIMKNLSFHLIWAMLEILMENHSMIEHFSIENYAQIPNSCENY